MSVLLISGNYTLSSGQSIVNEQVISCVSQWDDARVFVARGSSRGLVSQLLLILRVAAICVIEDIGTVYYAPSRSIRGIARDLVLYFVTASSRKRLVVHWHGSDLEVYSGTSMVARLGRRALARAVHICLCDAQEDLLRRVWAEADVRVLPNVLTSEFVYELAQVNSVAGAQQAVHGESDRAPITVATLGGVRWAKGIDTFCSVAQRMAHKGYRFLVYGPVTGDDRATVAEVQKLLERNHTVLAYLGPVYGRSKAEALLQTDVLLFPSRAEAYPLVVTEALTAGCWVVARNVGFIKAIRNWPKLLIIEDHAGNGALYEEAVRSLRIDRLSRHDEVSTNIERAERERAVYSSSLRKIIFGENLIAQEER